MFRFASKRLFFFLLTGGLAVSGAAPLRGLDLPVRQISDDSLLRIRLKDSWFSAVPREVREKSPVLHTLEDGARIELRVESGGDEFMIILARELMGGRLDDKSAPSAPVPRIPGGTFPGWAQGSWILTRRTDTGEPVRIRVFLRSDPYVYVQFRPFSAD
jgi:hypothetical protein